MLTCFRPAWTGSPLGRPEFGRAVQVGDVLLEVNGAPVGCVAELGEQLLGQVGLPTRLLVQASAASPPPTDRQQLKTRPVIVMPISAHAHMALRAEAWALERRRRVETIGGGQLGYVSLRDMEATGFGRFAEQFYPVHTRAGLLIDVRHNTGGNIDAWLLERLMRKAWMSFQPRSGGGYWNMPFAFRGPMAVLIDQESSPGSQP